LPFQNVYASLVDASPFHLPNPQTLSYTFFNPKKRHPQSLMPASAKSPNPSKKQATTLSPFLNSATAVGWLGETVFAASADFSGPSWML
jgi:hypothetical protein